MNDCIDNSDGLRISVPPPLLSHKQKRRGETSNKKAVLVCEKPYTVAFISNSTPKKTAEVKKKYAYLNMNPYEKTKDAIKGRILERTIASKAKEANGLSDENTLT